MPERTTAGMQEVEQRRSSCQRPTTQTNKATFGWFFCLCCWGVPVERVRSTNSSGTNLNGQRPPVGRVSWMIRVTAPKTHNQCSSYRQTRFCGFFLFEQKRTPGGGRAMQKIVAWLSNPDCLLGKLGVHEERHGFNVPCVH
jgi:hypothetical protein